MLAHFKERWSGAHTVTSAFRVPACASAVAALCVLLSTSSASAVSRSPTTYRLPAAPDNIAIGPNGDLWFTEWSAQRVVRLDPSGAMAVFDPGWNSPLRGIISGPDGRLWFSGVGVIGSITTAGAITPHGECSAPSTGIQSGTPGPDDLTVGPGGQIYFMVAADPWFVCRLDPATGATARVASLPATRAGISIVATGRYGLWVDTSVGVNNPAHPTEFLPPELVHVAYDGRVSVRSLAVDRADTQLPGGLAVASDGSVWVADDARLLRLDPRTGRLARIALPIARFRTAGGGITESYAAAGELAPGPHDQIWFTGSSGLLGELRGGRRLSSWRIPAGTTAGLAVLPGHGVYITYSSPAMIVVHR